MKGVEYYKRIISEMIVSLSSKGLDLDESDYYFIRYYESRIDEYLKIKLYEKVRMMGLPYQLSYLSKHNNFVSINEGIIKDWIGLNRSEKIDEILE